MENEIEGLQSQVAAAKVIIMPVRIGPLKSAFVLATLPLQLSP
jgi:hypothetical protein